MFIVGTEHFWLVIVPQLMAAHCCEELHALRSRIIKPYVSREIGSSPRARAKIFSWFLPLYPLLNASELISLRKFIAVVKCCPQHLSELLLFQVFPASDFFSKICLHLNSSYFNFYPLAFLSTNPQFWACPYLKWGENGIEISCELEEFSFDPVEFHFLWQMICPPPTSELWEWFWWMCIRKGLQFVCP